MSSVSVTRFGLVFLQDKESRYEKLVCSVNPLLNERVSLHLVASSKQSIATKKKKKAFKSTFAFKIVHLIYTLVAESTELAQ